LVLLPYEHTEHYVDVLVMYYKTADTI